LADRLAGFHLHDVQAPARDHCPPGTGMIDFAALKPCVRPEHLKVFEFSPSCPSRRFAREWPMCAAFGTASEATGGLGSGG
jgi:hypothetical protein